MSNVSPSRRQGTGVLTGPHSGPRQRQILPLRESHTFPDRADVKFPKVGLRDDTKGQQNREGRLLPEAQSLRVVHGEETWKTICSPNRSLQCTAVTFPHPCPKGSHPAEIHLGNLSDTQHERIATARIARRKLPDT